MSHFSVLVIGDNVEQQLAPYHEFECTGEDDQYVQDVDVTDECREKGLDWYGFEDRTITSMDQLDLGGNHKYGYALVDGAGALLKAVKRTNPNRQWDWWVEGGRWSGFLRTKDGASVDSAMAKDIDFAGMRDMAGTEAGDEWDSARAALTAAGAPLTWDSWEHTREALFKDNIGAARAHYNAQPSVVALRDFSGLYTTADVYMQPREAFVTAARNRAAVPYALVCRGEWTARGKTGWWGVSTDDMSQDDWNKAVNEMLDTLPPDTLLTIVDCHI